MADKKQSRTINEYIANYPLYTDGGTLKELLAPYKKEQNSIHLPLHRTIPI